MSVPPPAGQVEPPPSPPWLTDRSGNRYSIGDVRWQGDDGSPLMMSPMAGLTPNQIKTRERSLWRYQAALPVAPEHRVSLGEGWTPMIQVSWLGVRVHAKLEWFNPTSSFKDRGVSVMVSHLRGQGITRLLEDSSGNGGSAVAAYAAAAGISAKILVPAATSASKVLQARAYGAEIELVGGSRDDVSEEAIRQSIEIPYASHSWHPMFLQGTKTIAYEMWEMLSFVAPDNVVLVAGGGSTILGCDIGFSELLQAGQIMRRPRLFVGQPEHWATIADAVNGTDPTSRGLRVPTIAEGASIGTPVRLAEAVAAVRRSRGAAVAISDNQIRSAVRALATKGLFAEPTSGVAAATLDHFIRTGDIEPTQTTVVVLTGSGLKSAEKMAAIFGPADTVGSP